MEQTRDTGSWTNNGIVTQHITTMFIGPVYLDYIRYNYTGSHLTDTGQRQIRYSTIERWSYYLDIGMPLLGMTVDLY